MTRKYFPFFKKKRSVKKLKHKCKFYHCVGPLEIILALTPLIKGLCFEISIVEPHFYSVRYHPFFVCTVHFTKTYLRKFRKFSVGFISDELPIQKRKLI